MALIHNAPLPDHLQVRPETVVADELFDAIPKKLKIRALSEYTHIFTQYAGRSYSYHLLGVDHAVFCHPHSQAFFPWLTPDQFYTYPIEYKFHSGHRHGCSGQDVPLLLPNILGDCNPYKEWGPCWAIPPYREFYSKNNPLRETKKPIIVLNNKYQVEWKHNPHNYFPPWFLDQFGKNFTEKYEIWYIRYNGGTGYHDDVAAKDYADYRIAKKFNFTTIYDLIEETGLPYNVVQMYMLAKAKYIVTVNAGNAVLSSFFGEEVWQYHRGGDRDLSGYAGAQIHQNGSWINLFNKNNAVYSTSNLEHLLIILKHNWIQKEKPFVLNETSPRYRGIGFKKRFGFKSGFRKRGVYLNGGKMEEQPRED